MHPNQYLSHTHSMRGTTAAGIRKRMPGNEPSPPARPESGAGPIVTHVIAGDAGFVFFIYIVGHEVDVKRYMAVIFVVWAFAYALFWLGPGGHGKEEGEGSAARPAPIREDFEFRFISYTGKSSVNIELTEQRKVRDKGTGHVYTEDMATGLYKERKGPFPKDSEEFKIDPAYLKGMAEANLGNSFTLLTRKGQRAMVPEGLYYQSRGCGTEFVMMRLKPKKLSPFPGFQGDQGTSAPSDLFVLKQPHPPVHRMEVHTPEKTAVSPEMRELIKDELSRTFKKIRGLRVYSRSRVKPDPNPSLTYLKFPSRTGFETDRGGLERPRRQRVYRLGALPATGGKA